MTDLTIKAVQDRFNSRELMPPENNKLAAIFRADVGYLLSQLSNKQPDLNDPLNSKMVTNIRQANSTQNSSAGMGCVHNWLGGGSDKFRSVHCTKCGAAHPDNYSTQNPVRCTYGRMSICGKGFGHEGECGEVNAIITTKT